MILFISKKRLQRLVRQEFERALADVATQIGRRASAPTRGKVRLGDETEPTR